MGRPKGSKNRPKITLKGTYTQGGVLGNRSLTAGLVKEGGYDVTMKPSFFYSPELTTESWLLPKSRQEILKWARIFFNLEPYVQSIVMMHAYYPFSKFTISTPDKSITEFYKDMAFNEGFDLFKFILQASLSYQKFGEAIMFGNMEKGKDKLHRWTKFILLEPELVEIKSDLLSNDVSYELIPTEELKNLVKSVKPEDAERKKKLQEDTPAVIEAVIQGRNIQLDPEHVSHVARLTDPSATRGTSPIQCLFKVLIYQDWIRLAQSAFAQRYIFPVELWTIGDLPSGHMPSEQDLSNFRDIINQAIQNPPFTMVFPPIVKYEALSTLGKQFPINNEYDYIHDQLLVGMGVNKNIILGEGPSFPLSEDSRVLTKDGLKYHWELTENDLIASFNSKTEELEYVPFVDKLVIPYEGDMIHFKTSRVDHLVAPNHNCWNRKDNQSEWQLIKAKDVKTETQFRLGVNWEGKLLGDVNVLGHKIPTNLFMKLVGYFVSEGSSVYKEGRDYQVCVSQGVKSDCYQDIDQTFQQLPFKVHKYFDKQKYYSRKTKQTEICEMTDWRLFGKDLTQYFRESFGENSYSKRIPSWIKELSKEHLKVLLDALIKGDGNEDHSSSQWGHTSTYYTYTTKSRQLCDDVVEIALKCGFVPTFRYLKNEYVVYFSDSYQKEKGTFFLWDNKEKGIEGKIARGNAITNVPYKGNIWCIALAKNGLFVSERNGRLVITGNSNVKTMALHKLMMMYKVVRDEFENWIINKFFRPIAIKNEFYATVGKQKKLILPQITWNKSLDIEEEEAERQFFLDMHQKGYLSTETLFSKFPTIDYNTEQKRLENEIGTVWDKGGKDSRLPAKISKPTPPSGTGPAGIVRPTPIEPIEPTLPEGEEMEGVEVPPETPITETTAPEVIPPEEPGV